MPSSFSIPYWSSATTYQTNDVVYMTGAIGDITYFYALSTNVNFDPRINPSRWTTNFVWKPDMGDTSELLFNTLIASKEKANFNIRQAQFANNVTFKASLSFTNRDDREAKAILHYVESRNGANTFDFTNDIFDGTGLKFRAINTKHDHIFYNNNNISFELEQFN